MSETPEKWWLEVRPLTGEEQARLTPVQQAERRLMMVNRSVAKAEAKLDATRRKRVVRLLRQWFRGEVMRDTAVDSSGSPIQDIRRWLRTEFVQATKDAFKGFSADHVVAEVVRQEVGRALQGIIRPGSSINTRDGKAYAESMRRYIGKIVEEEVRKQVIANMSFEATISGHVHHSAKGQRAMQLLDKPEGET